MWSQLREIRENAKELKETAKEIKSLDMASHLSLKHIEEMICYSISLEVSLYTIVRGCYIVGDKIEWNSSLIAQIIRNRGHSISKSSESTKDCVILEGKRKDSGDILKASFSLQEAKDAGLYSTNKVNVWTRYPERMLFARALSILVRELFSDILGCIYIEGEIQESFDEDFQDNQLKEESISL